MMGTVRAMHRMGLEGQVLVIPEDGRLGTVTRAFRVQKGDLVKTADHEGVIQQVESPVGGGHTYLQFAGYGFGGTEIVRSAELLVVIVGGEAA